MTDLPPKINTMGESSFGARGQLTPDRGRGAGEVAGVGGSGALSGILNGVFFFYSNKELHILSKIPEILHCFVSN